MVVEGVIAQVGLVFGRRVWGKSREKVWEGVEGWRVFFGLQLYWVEIVIIRGETAIKLENCDYLEWNRQFKIGIAIIWGRILIKISGREGGDRFWMENEKNLREGMQDISGIFDISAKPILLSAKFSIYQRNRVIYQRNFKYISERLLKNYEFSSKQ